MPNFSPFDWQPRTRLVAGPGAVARLGELARELDATRVLLVTDPGIIAAGHVERAVASLHEAGVSVVLYDRVRENPTTRDVDAALAVAREAGIDALIGLGGGSSIDTAKGCNFLLTNGGRMQDFWGVGKAKRPMLPLIAVPTTAGTGSECQSYALIADEETHQKMACGDPKAAPRIALLDPELTLSQPRFVTACTGIDALAHALESAVTRPANAMSRLFSAAAFRLTGDNLARVLAEPASVEARAAMQLGAAFAGTAIELSMLGAAHAAANPLTARFGVVHGHAVGLMLPHVLRFNGQEESAEGAYRSLLDSANRTDRSDRTDQSDPSHPSHSSASAAHALADRMVSLMAAAGLPTHLTACGVPHSALPTLAEEAAKQWTARFNPREVTARDFEAMYEAALGE